jgi:hypothetical protein
MFRIQAEVNREANKGVKRTLENIKSIANDDWGRLRFPSHTTDVSEVYPYAVKVRPEWWEYGELVFDIWVLDASLTVDWTPIGGKSGAGYTGLTAQQNSVSGAGGNLTKFSVTSAPLDVFQYDLIGFRFDGIAHASLTEVTIHAMMITFRRPSERSGK